MAGRRPPGGALTGRTVLVMGASAGIGRAMAIRAVKAGACVVMGARRRELLEAVCAEAGGGHPVTADLCLETDCERLAATARDRLGRIDVLVSTVGVAPLRMIADTTGEDWRRVFETNVVGTHRLLRACLPLLAPGAMVMCLSSETVHQPRTALGAYASSKAALDRMVEGWRTEHPGVRFTRVTVGATFPTGFGDEFDPGLLGRALHDWGVRGLAQEELMSPDEVADVLTGVIAAADGHPGVGLDHLTVRSPSPVVGSFRAALDDTAPASAGPATRADPTGDGTRADA